MRRFQLGSKIARGGSVRNREGTMSDTTNNPLLAAIAAACDCGTEATHKTSHSRRDFLRSGGIVAAAGAAALLPQASLAQQTNLDTDPALRRLLGSQRILLKGGTVLTLDRQIGDFAKADVMIEDGKIREIQPNIVAGRDVQLVDATNHIVIPGFVDTHSHTYQGLLRGILANGLLEPDYNRDIQTTLTPTYSATDAYSGMLVSALGFLEMGTTTIVDLSQVSHTPEHSDACIKALKDSGIRAVYSYARGAGPAARYPQDIKRIQSTYFSTKDQLLTLAITGNMTAEVYRAGRDAGVPVVQHLVGTDLSGQVLEFGRAGLLKPGDEFIHCLGLNDAAWKLIKDSGARISICAPIDMALGHGMPAIQAALDHGLRMSLSSDHGVTVAQDIFSVMRTTFALQRLLVLQRIRNGEKNTPPLLTCRDVLEFATIEGARCANLDDKIGTLTPGKDADILLLKADRLDVWPLNNAYSAAVNLMNPGHIDAVFVAGRVKKWKGALVGVDTQRVMREAENARDGLLIKAKFQKNLLG